MASDNQNVTSLPGDVSKTTGRGGGKWRNLIIAGAMLALPAASGWMAFGVGISYENSHLTNSGTGTGTVSLNSARTEVNGIIPLVVIEASAGGFAAGGSGDVLTYLTPDGTIAIESGALLIGPNGNPNITLSGSTIIAKSTLSGGTLKLGLASAGKSLTTDTAYPLCVKTNGTVGYLIRTATGFVRGTCT